ncbi:hypothetical protein EV1_015656 [Malus domestica]
MEWTMVQHLDLRHVGRSSKLLQPHAAAFHPHQAFVAVVIGNYIIEIDALTAHLGKLTLNLTVSGDSAVAQAVVCQLSDFQVCKQRNNPDPPATATPRSYGLKRRLTLYRAFSGLTKSRHTQQPINPSSTSDIESQAILVNSVNENVSESYQMTFLMAAEKGGVQELEYFKRLDDEFNKVDKFYRSKVDKVMKEVAVLNKQMDALITFRIKVENPQRMFDWSREMTRHASDAATPRVARASTIPHGAKANSEYTHHH